MKKLAIVITHPIQYYAPFFKILSKFVELKVFYSAGNYSKKFDHGFQQEIHWDLELLNDYNHEFVENKAKNPGSHHFWGIQNPSIIKKIDSYQPDVLLVYGWAYASHLKIISHYKNVLPIFFRGDSTLLDAKLGFKLILRKILLSWIYKHIDKALYVGSANRDYFKYFGLKAHQLSFLPHAVDNNRFAENRNSEAVILRKSLGIEDKVILILFAGKLESKKNPELLLQAYLKLRLPNVHLLFVGSGHLESGLKQDVIRQIESDKLSKIHFMDFQNQMQMPVIYQACDLFCLPSKGPGETWGLAINEAMASGKAILVSDKVGSAFDLVKPGVNGFIFCDQNVSDLYENLKHLCSSKDLLLSYGQASKSIIYQWSFDEQLKYFLPLLSNDPE